MKRILYFFLLILFIIKTPVLITGCAQIVSPTGGPRDSIPPVLVRADPPTNTTNFRGNRINLYFDEYVEVRDIQQNLLVSPTPKNNPYIDYKLRNVSIRLRDTLEPNTTYTINLGNSIRDINESNILKEFSYVFSTGPAIDSMMLTGNVLLAETGKVDSTMIVLLYSNLADSAALKIKPKYIARVKSDGSFAFQNLSGGEYKVYALKDSDGSRTYNISTELFAFLNNSVIITDTTQAVTMYAYAAEKDKPRVSTATERTLKYTSSAGISKQDILTDIKLQFNRPLRNIDKNKLILTDTLNNVIANVSITTDTTNKIVSVKAPWKLATDYQLIILKDFATDTTGLQLTKSDTLRLKTKGETDYGIIRMKFVNFDKSKNPVLQFVQNNEVISSHPLTSETWNAPLFNPGEYEMRILFDDNRNGIWDPGNFTIKKQPEKVYNISQRLTVQQNFEKDIEIVLPK